MKNVILILFGVFLVNYISKSQDIELKINSSTDTIFNTVFKKGNSRILILSNNWELNYQRHLRFDLKVSEKDTITIETICEDEEISICLVDSTQNIITVGVKPENRFYKRRITASLERGKYSLILGSGTTHPEIPLKIAIHNKNSKVRWRNDDIKTIDLQNKKIEGYIDSTYSTFENKKSYIYRINIPYLGGSWYKLTCYSDDFRPFIIGLNSSEEVELAEYYDTYLNKYPSIILSPYDTVKYIVVGTKSNIDFKERPKFRYSISVKKYSHDPNESFFTRIKNGLTPINTFILGLVFAFIVSYYFYWKSIKSRKFMHWEVSDNILLSQDEERKEHLMSIGKKTAYSVSHYRYQFENAGRKRISHEQIKNDIILKLSNIKKIMDLNFSFVGEGWIVPEQINDNSIKIDFNHIDAKDSLTLSIICEIGKEVQMSHGVQAEVSGYISETDIYERIDKPRSLLSFLIHLTNYLNFIILLPLLFIINSFDIDMPNWYHSFSSIYWPITGVLVYLYIFTIGRGYLFDIPKILWYHLKKIFRKSKNTKLKSPKN